MTPHFAHLPTNDDIDGLLLKAAASGRISSRDLDTLIAYVISLRTGGVRPGLVLPPRTD